MAQKGSLIPHHLAMSEDEADETYDEHGYRLIEVQALFSPAELSLVLIRNTTYHML